MKFGINLILSSKAIQIYGLLLFLALRSKNTFYAFDATTWRHYHYHHPMLMLLQLLLLLQLNCQLLSSPAYWRSHPQLLSLSMVLRITAFPNAEESSPSFNDINFCNRRPQSADMFFCGYLCHINLYRAGHLEQTDLIFPEIWSIFCLAYFIKLLTYLRGLLDDHFLWSFMKLLKYFKGLLDDHFLWSVIKLLN